MKYAILNHALSEVEGTIYETLRTNLSAKNAKQTQFWKRQNERKLFCDKYIRDFARLLRPQNKANSNPISSKAKNERKTIQYNEI